MSSSIAEVDDAGTKAPLELESAVSAAADLDGD
jgi:hypothetical protein